MEIIISNGKVVGVASFTDGFVPLKRTPRRMSENDILATAMWLEKHDRQDEGLTLIDQWSAGFVLYFH